MWNMKNIRGIRQRRFIPTIAWVLYTRCWERQPWVLRTLDIIVITIYSVSALAQASVSSTERLQPRAYLEDCLITGFLRRMISLDLVVCFGLLSFSCPYFLMLEESGTSRQDLGSLPQPLPRPLHPQDHVQSSRPGGLQRQRPWVPVRSQSWFSRLHLQWDPGLRVYYASTRECWLSPPTNML